MVAIVATMFFMAESVLSTLSANRFNREFMFWNHETMPMINPTKSNAKMVPTAEAMILMLTYFLLVVVPMWSSPDIFVSPVIHIFL